MADNFTFLFLTALTLSVVTRIWLARRHIRHVLAHRDTVPSSFASSIPLAAHQKAADYTVARTRFVFLGLAVETALLLAFTLGGGLAALADFWSLHLDGLWHGLALIFSTLLISGISDIPLAAWRQFVIEARFGFNRMTPGLFVSDLVKGTVLGCVIGTPLILAVLWLMGVMGEYWWLYVWGLWCAFNLFILFAYPTWIAPLFNKFTPLADSETKDRIVALLDRCGFRSGGLFVMDGSKRSAHGNAYFTGFGQTKRIVFFDTLLERLQPAEIEAVLAHELGHFQHRHIQKRIMLMFVISFAFLALLGQLASTAWFFSGLGVTTEANHSQAMALLLFFLVLPSFTFLLTPLGSLLSRRHEFEADRYASEHADGDHLVLALTKLYEDNASTLTPDPLYSLFYDSHPPAAIRIAHLRQGTA